MKTVKLQKYTLEINRTINRTHIFHCILAIKGLGCRKSIVINEEKRANETSGGVCMRANRVNYQPDSARVIMHAG